MNNRIAVATVAGCVAALPILGLGPGHVGHADNLQGRRPPPSPTTEFATMSKLPSLGSNAEAHAVNEAGTVVVGHSFDRAGFLFAVTWTLQNGSWAVSTLPYPGTAARAEGIDNDGNVAGYAANAPARPVLWPAQGGYQVLGCDNVEARSNGISADGQVVVGQGVGPAAGGARLWRAPAYCAELLPPLQAGNVASATAPNGDGSLIGGSAFDSAAAATLPVRWINVQGQWHIQQLDIRPGHVRGGNAAGDLAGEVRIPCASESGCSRATLWYAGGGSRDLGTLGGAQSWANGINSQQEVVGMSSSARGVTTAYFWSASMGLVPLPSNKWVVANAVSNVRSDGSRLVVGMDAQANAAVWIVRTP